MCRGRVGQARTADPSPPGVPGGPDAQARGRTGHGRADRSGAEGAVGGSRQARFTRMARGAVHQAWPVRRPAGRAAGPRSRHAAAGPTGSRAGIADLAGQGGWQQQRRRIGQDADIGLLVAAERAMLAAFVRIVLRRLAAVVRAHVDLNQARAVGAQYSTDTRCAGCAGLNARASDGTSDAHRITASAIHMAGRVRKEAEHMSADYIGADPRAGSLQAMIKDPADREIGSGRLPGRRRARHAPAWFFA